MPVEEHPNWPPGSLQQTWMCSVLRWVDVVPAAPPVPWESCWEACKTSTLGEARGWMSVSFLRLFNKASLVWDPIFSGLYHFLLFWLLEAQGLVYSLARLAVNWEGSSWHAMASPRLGCPLTQEAQWENYSYTGKSQAITKQGQALFPCPLCLVLGYFYSHCLNSAFFESRGRERGRLEMSLSFGAWSMVRQDVPNLPVQPSAP